MRANALFVGVCLVVMQGCHGKPQKPLKPSVASASVDAQASDARAEETPADVAVNGPVWQFVEAWSSAIDRHDVKALEPMYADRVSFYGQRRSKGEVISAKQSAFAAEPDFHQQIPGFIAITRGNDNYYVAKFYKLSGKLGSLQGTDAKLVIGHAEGGPLLIREEADSEAAERRNSDCAQVAADIVQSIPEVKRALADADARSAASKGALRVGGLGPEDLDAPDGFFVSLGVNSDERFETVVSYEVTREGALTVNVVPYGGKVVIPPGALRKVAKICRR